jgi:hypothetical protein
VTDRETNTFRILAIVVGIFVVLILAWAVFTLVGERDTVDPLAADDQIPTHDDARLDEFEGRLEVAEYRYESAARRVEGSVVNETDYPIVNVQVEFVVLGIEGDSLTAVRDTTSEVAPRETWQFSISVPGDEPVSDVRPVRVTGAQRQVEGAEAIAPRRRQPATEPVNP